MIDSLTLTKYHQLKDKCLGLVYTDFIDWFQDGFKCNKCDWHIEIPNCN